jgi:hypothetical protein
MVGRILSNAFNEEGILLAFSVLLRRLLPVGQFTGCGGCLHSDNAV